MNLLKLMALGFLLEGNFPYLFSKSVKKFKFNFILWQIFAEFSASKKKRELMTNPGTYWLVYIFLNRKRINSNPIWTNVPAALENLTDYVWEINAV